MASAAGSRDEVEAHEKLLAAAAIITALTVLWKWPVVGFVLDRLIRRPVGEAIDARIDERVAPRFDEIEAKVDAVLAQVTQNGGSSLHDKVDGLVRDNEKDDEVDALGRQGRIERRE